jgi:integrase
MAGATNKLNDRSVRSWIRDPKRTPAKLFDGDGLFLTLTERGTAVWRLRYRIAGRDKIFSIGQYPEIGLAAARDARTTARLLIREGRDPVVDRRAHRAEAAASSGHTFAEVSQTWLKKNQPGWSEPHFRTVSETLDRHVLKSIGSLPIQECSHALVASVVEKLGERVDTALKVRQICMGVFRYAQAKGLFVGENPAIAAREVIARRKLKGRRPALLTWAELGDLLRRAEAANLSSAVRMAHRLCAFTATRIGNVISAEWTEFDLDADQPMWVIARAKMKAQNRHFDHKVILGAQIAGELRQWRKAIGGAGQVFPAVAGGSKHISPEAIEKAYRVTLGLKGKHSPHGWRSAFSTLARDNGFGRDAVELALDHVHDEAVARAYDRGQRLLERVKLADWWCQELVKAERGQP